MKRVATIALWLAAHPAFAQPAADPPPADPAPPLASIRDAKQLAAALASITQDPTIPVDDPKVRALAQALMIEGVKQLDAKNFDQALANFLEAYGKLPSPRILLNIGSTLRDMGRSADAANTYQRYILDPGSGADRVGEVKQLLLQLDAQLTILTVHVFPRGSDISIDGGPFIPVGSTLLTRVRAGIHLVRIQHGTRSAEMTVNGFEGESKEIAATLPVEVDETPVKPPPTPVKPPVGPTPVKPPPAPVKPAEPPDRVDAWLTTGTAYTSGSPGGNDRRVRNGFQGEEILPIIPRFDTTVARAIQHDAEVERHISSGLLGMLRIDGEGRGVASGLGLAVAANNRVELELAVLRSDQWGGYLGIRVRLLTGWFRPYLAAGMPVFAFTDDQMPDDPTKIAIGVRGAGGIEIKINGHFSVHGDLGYEHFYHLGGTAFDASLVVPTLAVVGRL